MLEIVITTVVGVVTLYLGSIEVRMRNINDKVSDKPGRREVTKEIEVHLASEKVLLRELKEDIKEIKADLKRLANKD